MRIAPPLTVQDEEHDEELDLLSRTVVAVVAALSRSRSQEYGSCVCGETELKRFTISVDTGGTFTDFVLLDRERGSVTTAKVLTTPSAPDDAIFQGFEQLAVEADFDLMHCDTLLHATTLITNALIERKGQDFILVHTEGFGTMLETGREHRYSLSDLRLSFPEPITRHRLKVAVRERVLADGTVHEAPEKGAVLGCVRALVTETGITNFAVCFLHSFRNPANENSVAAWLAEAVPKAFISVSHAVAPLQREYERWLTCAVNAYTKPMLGQYVRRIQRRAREQGFDGRLMLMTSSGLPLPVEQCVESPVRLIESGPAAGVLAAREIAARNRDGDGEAATVLAYDMGGTTAKGSFLVGGRVDVKPGLEVAREGAFAAGSGFPLYIPAIDLIEIGAGGGSIAEIDDRGTIAVGPRSAGATPGPACYDQGGESATGTDANLVLGLLGEVNFHNSGIQAKSAAARDAIERTVARPLGLSVERAAMGIHRTINENVARAFRVHAAELGIDYRRSALVCTGGSAPIHAATVARLLYIDRIIYPFAAGVASAFGLFAGTEGISLQRSYLIGVNDLPEDGICAQIADMVASHPYAASLLAEGAKTTVKLGMRYEGQNSEVTVIAGTGADVVTPEGARERFLAAYEGIFGLRFPAYSVEISTWGVEVAMPAPIANQSQLTYSTLTQAQNAEKGYRYCYLGEGEGDSRVEVAVFDRYALRPGWEVSGPAVIEEQDTTIFIPSGTVARVAPSFDLIAENEL